MSAAGRKTWEPPTESWLDDLEPKLRKQRVLIDEVAAVEPPLGPALSFGGYLALGGVTWRLEGELVIREADGRAVVSTLSLRALRPRDAAITARLAAKVPVGIILKHARRKLADEETAMNFWAAWARTVSSASGPSLGVPAPPPEPDLERLRSARRAFRGTAAPPRGRLGTPHEFYYALATEAVDLAARGLPVTPGLVTSRRRPERTVKGWIAKARSRGIGALDPRPGVWKLGPNHPDRSFQLTWDGAAAETPAEIPMPHEKTARRRQKRPGPDTRR